MRDFRNRVSGKLWILDFMFPYTNDPPTKRLQFFVVGAIAFHIPLEFGLPIVAVARGAGGMFRASMPEAPIDEKR